MTDLAPTDDRLAETTPAEPAPPPTPVTAQELAAFLAARMCHDYISPAGAIVSGLDLLDDPSAQDMRDDALGLIATSARKLVALLQFDRIAFGASAAAESFDTRALEALTRDVFGHIRAELQWSVETSSLAKPAARTLLNLAQIAGAALPTGGVAALRVVAEDGETLITAHSTGARARLRPEVIDGLNGLPLGEGLGGHWVQAYYLRGIVEAAGGSLEVAVEPESVMVRARLPGVG